MFAAFQATFAGITACLIIGAFAERVKFSAVLAFLALWFAFSYLPVAHMVWFWAGPGCYTSAEVVDKVNALGCIWQMGALDFAGGTVVHINAAVAGLVGATWSASASATGRKPSPAQPDADHGRCLAAVGGLVRLQRRFRAGSQRLRCPGLHQHLRCHGGCRAGLGAGEACSGQGLDAGCSLGAVAGLVAITPAAGNVGIGGGLVIGFCGWLRLPVGASGLKKMLGADDSLDVFGVHGIGGIIGALLTGVFNSPALGGLSAVGDWVTAAAIAPDAYSIGAQFLTQAKAVGITIVWSGLVSVIAYKLVDMTIGLRVTEEEEREGPRHQLARRDCVSQARQVNRFQGRRTRPTSIPSRPHRGRLFCADAFGFAAGRKAASGPCGG